MAHSHNHDHDHGHGHHHHHHHHADMGERKLVAAIVINMFLTVFQIVAGIFSGSLALLADALHNFGDAGALIVALVARRYTKRPADQAMSFGYERAEIVGALVNATSLFIMAFYLCLEAISRIFKPEPIAGKIVIIAAVVALVIDIGTALLTYSESKNSMNFKAAFIHNLTDALASVVVIISGVLSLYFDSIWFDIVATLMISIYVIFHGKDLFLSSIKILMQGTPAGLKASEIKSELMSRHNLAEVHHIHIWQLDEHKRFFEGHLVVKNLSVESYRPLKEAVRATLKERFGISHTTLEIECLEDGPCDHEHKA